MHIPVLLNEIRSLLDIQQTDCVFDGTVNGAGHALATIPSLKKGTYIACDTDESALERAKKALHEYNNVFFVHANFRDLSTTLKALPASPNKFLFDLGWSMNQFDDATRGFSFMHDGPLDMRYDPSTQQLTAADIVNTWQHTDLINLLKGYAEESFALKITKAIIAEREKNPITTTKQLADIVSQSVPAGYRRGKVHPATKTFQALRIAVNDEFGAIETGLASALAALPKGGRIAVITFHSLEDRIVKNIFKGMCTTDSRYVLINKKVVTASQDELQANPRSRSAKLRVISRLH